MHAVFILCCEIDVSIRLAPIHALHVRIEIPGHRFHLLVCQSHQIELCIYHAWCLSLFYILSDAIESLRRTGYEDALAVWRELGTIDEFSLLYQSLHAHIVQIETIEGIDRCRTLGKTLLALADEQIAGVGRDIVEIYIVIAESKRLEDARCQIILGKIAAGSPSWLSVIRLLYIKHLSILLSAFCIKRVDKRFLIRSKLEPAFRNISRHHLALHIQRIDGDKLHGSVCLSFTGNGIVARLLDKVHLVGARHPSYVLLKGSNDLVGLAVSQLVDAMVLALTVYPSLTHNHKLAIWRKCHT